jgi:hypothetical protein
MTQISSLNGNAPRANWAQSGLDRLAVLARSQTPSKPAATSAARVQLGSVHSGQENDRVSGDYPRVNGKVSLPAGWQSNPALRTLANHLSTKSDADLFSLFGKEYRLASHFNDTTASQLARFRASTGGTVVSQPGSTMSELVANSDEGQALGSTLTDRLQTQAQRQFQASGTVDVNKLAVKLDLSDRLSWGKNPTNPMFGLVGSTDGAGADLLNARYSSITGRLTGTMRITVVDRFGLSNQDNDSPGQVAMWLLQHQRGYRSFENRIVYDVPVDVVVSPPKLPNCNPRFTSCPVP